MSGLPTGQYQPGDSVLHRLDAGAKLLCLLLLLAAVLATGTLAGYVVLGTVLGLVIWLSHLPLRQVAEPVVRMWLLFVTTFLMNALCYAQGTAIASWWIFHISYEGAWQGLRVTVHMSLILMLGNVLMMTTPPLEITTALERFLRPLKLLRVPTEDVAMTVSIAIRFIPTLLEETDAIRKAQIARGARFESRRLSERAASFLPLLVPIFLSAFRRADELSTAMEARGYRSALGRTKPKRDALRWADYAVVTASMAVCAVQFVV